MADDTKKVHMTENYVVKRGALKGRNLFLNQYYELDADTAKEVEEAGAGEHTQKQKGVSKVVPIEASTEEDKEVTAQRR